MDDLQWAPPGQDAATAFEHIPNHVIWSAQEPVREWMCRGWSDCASFREVKQPAQGHPAQRSEAWTYTTADLTPWPQLVDHDITEC